MYYIANFFEWVMDSLWYPAAAAAGLGPVLWGIMYVLFIWAQGDSESKSFMDGLFITMMAVPMFLVGMLLSAAIIYGLILFHFLLLPRVPVLGNKSLSGDYTDPNGFVSGIAVSISHISACFVLLGAMIWFAAIPAAGIYCYFTNNLLYEIDFWILARDSVDGTRADYIGLSLLGVLGLDFTSWLMGVIDEATSG